MFASAHARTEWAVERLYWVHVEYFPMHHESYQLEFSQIVDDLYDIISHGQAGKSTSGPHSYVKLADPRTTDRLTSKTSTFPYTAETCRHFLKLLSRKRGGSVLVPNPNSLHITSMSQGNAWMAIPSVTQVRDNRTSFSVSHCVI